jgi:hypothetical membrane protein
MTSGKTESEGMGEEKAQTSVHNVVFPLAGVAGPVFLVLSDLICASFNPRYDLVYESISDQVFGPLGWLQTLSFYLFGILEIIFTLGFRRCMQQKRGFRTGIAVLFMIGLGFLIIASFHTDPPGYPRTLEGAIHIHAAEIIALLFPVACFLLAPSFKHDTRWKHLFPYTIIAGIVGLVLAVGRMRPMTQWVWFGLHERVMVLNAMIWMELAALRLLKLQGVRSGFFSSFRFWLQRGKSPK